jgi:hypothetical protein
MSPDDKGEYFYGSGQDAVNDAWIVNAFIGFGKSGDVQRQIVLGSSQFIQESVVATHYAFYPPPNWTLVDRFGNAARAYEPVLGVQLPVSGGLGAKALVGRGVVFIRTLIGGGAAACAVEEEECVDTANRAIQTISRIEVLDAKLRYVLEQAPAKAQGFQQLGHTPSNMEQLRQTLVSIAQGISLSNPSVVTDFGTKFEETTEVVGPNGAVGRIITVWQIDKGSDVLRFITAIPQPFK